MSLTDTATRTLGGRAFFGLREAEGVLRALDGRTGKALVDAVLSMKGGTKITAYGLEHVPPSGPVLIGSTHPIGTFDFLAHAGALLAHRPDLKVVANREAERFLGKERIIAVDFDRKDNVLSGRATMAGMKAHLDQNGVVLVFGSGRVARQQDGVLIEPMWRTGLTRMSKETNARIIPASANMRNSKQYYSTRRLFTLLSGGNDDFGRTVASLRYFSELYGKLGGAYDVHYGPAAAPGTPPEALQSLAEALVPGLYRPVRG